MSQMWTFLSCSDENKGEDLRPGIPVNYLSVPAEVVLGEDLNVLGIGFTGASELYLKDEKGGSTELTVKSRNEYGVLVTIPATLSPGIYKLVLKQGEEWEIQNIRLIPACPLKNLDLPDYVERGAVLTLKGEGFADNCKVSLESEEGDQTELEILTHLENGSGLELRIPDNIKTGTYFLFYAIPEVEEWHISNLDIMAQQRLKKVVASDIRNSETAIYTIGYDEQNRVNSIVKKLNQDEPVSYSLIYSENGLKVMAGDEECATYTLSGGHIDHVSFMDWDGLNEEDWEYDTDGYLTYIEYLGMELNITDGNINYNDGYEYGEGCLVNNFRQDVFVYMLAFGYRTEFNAYVEIPLLAGLAGKRTVHLPTVDYYDDVTYETKGEYVNKIKATEGDKLVVFYEFDYELQP